MFSRSLDFFSAAPSDSLLNWSNVAASIATIGGLVAAMIAAAIAFHQLKLNRQSALEADALSVHREYLVLCIQNPELTSTDAFLLSKKLENGRIGLLPNMASQEVVSLELERYKWFMSYALNVCEKIIIAFPRNQDWLATARSQISYHCEGLKEFWPSIEAHYDPNFRHLVASILLEFNVESQPVSDVAPSFTENSKRAIEVG